MKTPLALAAAALLLTSLSACSGDSDGSSGSSGSYCDQLEKSKDSFSSLGTAQLSDENFTKTRDEITQLQQAASGSIADDWATLGGSLDDIKAAVEKAGISLSDLSGLTSGTVPPGLDPNQAQEVVNALTTIGTDPALSAAVNEIQADAKTTCKITLQAG